MWPTHGAELVLVPEGNTVKEMGLVIPCDTNTKTLLIIEFVSFRSQIDWQSNRAICLVHPPDSSVQAGVPCVGRNGSAPAAGKFEIYLLLLCIRCGARFVMHCHCAPLQAN